MNNKFVLSLCLIAAAAPLAANAQTNKALQELKDSPQTAAPETAATPASAPAPETKPAPLTAAQQLLLTKTAQDIEALYRRSEPGPIPEGASQGAGTVSPGTDEGRESQELISFLWQGKIFERIDDSSATLVNKTIFGDAFSAKVYFGESLLDGKKSIIIDYSETSYKPFRIIRDEIRRVAPGVYLGYAYLRGVKTAPVIFALDFNAPKTEAPAPAPAH
jgi:hypothetical protein